MPASLSKLISPQGDGNGSSNCLQGKEAQMLSKLISPQGDGNCLAVADPMMQSCFPNSLPRKGMETNIVSPIRMNLCILPLSQITSPQGDGNPRKKPSRNAARATFPTHFPAREWKRDTLVYLPNICTFPNSLPRKGMETTPLPLWGCYSSHTPFPTHFPARGWKEHLLLYSNY